MPGPLQHCPIELRLATSCGVEKSKLLEEVKVFVTTDDQCSTNHAVIYGEKVRNAFTFIS